MVKDISYGYLLYSFALKNLEKVWCNQWIK